jgi:hypothetical protein
VVIDYYKIHPECLLPAVREYISKLDGSNDIDSNESENDGELNKIYKGTGYHSINGQFYRFKDEDTIMIAGFIPLPKGQIYRDDGVTRQTFLRSARIRTAYINLI